MMEHNWKIVHELRSSLTQNSRMSFKEGLFNALLLMSGVCFKLRNVEGITLLTLIFDVVASA